MAYLGQQFDVIVSYTTLSKDASLFVALTRESKWYGGLQIPLKQGKGTMLVSGIEPQNGALPGVDYTIDAFTTSGFVSHVDDDVVHLAADTRPNFRLRSSSLTQKGNLTTSAGASETFNSACEDLVPDWKDDAGATCADYGRTGLCKDATIVVSEVEARNTLSEVTQESPDSICCVCGGGRQAPASSSAALGTKPTPASVEHDECDGGLSEFGKKLLGRQTDSEGQTGVLSSVTQVETPQNCALLCTQYGAGMECHAFQYSINSHRCDLLDRTSGGHTATSTEWITHVRHFSCHTTKTCKGGIELNFAPPTDMAGGPITHLSSIGSWSVTTNTACASKCLAYGLKCRGFFFEESAKRCTLQVPSQGDPPAGVGAKAKTCASLGWALQYGNTDVCGTSLEPCVQSADFRKAEAHCHSIGSRLCTAQEFKEDAARGTGCYGDKAFLWTSDTCSLGERTGHLVARGRSNSNSALQPVCKDDAHMAAALRCCADESLQYLGLFYKRNVKCRQRSTPVPETTTALLSRATPAPTSAAQTYCADCVRQYSPVCGSDQKVYFNPCFADCNNVYQYSSGLCKPDAHEAVCSACSTSPYSPVCADGTTYFSTCFSNCHNATRVEEGFCSLDAVHQNLKDEAKSKQSCATLGHTPQNAGRYPKTCAFSTVYGKCYADQVWSYGDAQAICKSAGARLCTVGELDNDVARGTGCDIDNDYVWTSDLCQSGMYVSGGSSAVRSKKTLMCASKEAKIASVRCCADVLETSNVLPPGETRSSTSSSTRTSTTTGTSTTVSTTTATTLTQGPSYCKKLGMVPQTSAFPTVCAFSEINGFCFNLEKYPLEAAEYLCESVDSRLCSANELSADVAKDTGCAIDAEYVWSGDKCPKGNLVVAGSSAAAISKPTRCVATTSIASIRCCSHYSAAPTPAKTTVQPDAATTVPNPCGCHNKDKPVCGFKDSNRQQYANLCWARCDNVDSIQKGNCPPVIDTTKQVNEVGCTTKSSNSVKSFTIFKQAKIENSAKHTIGQRLTMKTIRLCTQACLDAGHQCVAVEWHGKSKWCELKSVGAEKGLVKNNRWKLYNRKSFC